MTYIERHLKLCWSPVTIAHEWNMLVNAGIISCDTITGMTIYGIIKSVRPEWKKYLAYRKKRKYHKGLAGKHLILDRMDIAGRGEVEFGDWEADTVIGCRGSKSCLGVFVERTTRLYKVVKMNDKTADEMVRAAGIAFGGAADGSGLYVRSITYDNGLENARHGSINALFDCVSWFSRAYRSTDKAQIENRNKQLRAWLPKRTNFDLIDGVELAKIEALINDRPMKCLDWLSPSQAYLIAQMLHFKL
jgi:IS30 family transposase